MFTDFINFDGPALKKMARMFVRRHQNWSGDDLMNVGKLYQKLVPKYFPNIIPDMSGGHMTDNHGRKWVFKSMATEASHVILHNSYRKNLLEKNGRMDLRIDFLVVIYRKDRILKITERDMVNELKYPYGKQFRMNSRVPGTESFVLKF